MGIEDEIRGLLSQGYTPQAILASYPHKKSTVYKVYRELSTRLVPTTPPPWYVTIGPEPDTRRYLPGQTERFNCELRNTSGGMDLYVLRSGLQPEWLRGQWHVSEERFLLRPGESRSVRVDVPIPPDMALGEYELQFGVQGKLLGPGISTPYDADPIQWADPFILHIKQPYGGFRLFLSHSVMDMFLVRQIEQHLDANGIQVIIGEDVKAPGAVLEAKFEQLIVQSHFFLALLTENGARSEWVIKETNYAHQINKPMLLLKEKEASVTSSREWIEFSRCDDPEVIWQSISEAMDHLRKYPTGVPLPGPAHPLLLVGLGLFLGVVLSKSSGQAM